ncbi:MAG: hypothetical protein ACK559_11835, partial [bacterium]
LRIKPNQYKTPVFFHNAEGFDNHLLINAIFDTNNKLSPELNDYINNRPENTAYDKEFIKKELAKSRQLNCIARTGEKLMTMSTNEIDVRDSYKLTLSSLHNLIYNRVIKDPLVCCKCSGVLDTAKKVTNDNKYFRLEFKCRECEEYGHKLPPVIKKIDKRIICRDLPVMTTIATEE